MTPEPAAATDARSGLLRRAPARDAGRPGLAVAGLRRDRSRRPDRGEDRAASPSKWLRTMAAGEPQPSADTWVRGERGWWRRVSVPVGARCRPTGPSTCPANEGTQAGIAWRQACGRAGYAVVSPAGTDHRVWTSPPARAGRVPSPSSRTGLTPPWRNGWRDARHALDRLRPCANRCHAFRPHRPGPVAVAGFDVGARTAMAWRGAPSGPRHPAQAGAGPGHRRDQSGRQCGKRGSAERFGAVSLPLLVVTGTGTRTRMQSSTRPLPARRRLFRPAGRQILLVLADGIHATCPEAPAPLPDAGDAGAGEGLDEDSTARRPAARAVSATVRAAAANGPVRRRPGRGAGWHGGTGADGPVAQRRGTGAG